MRLKTTNCIKIFIMGLAFIFLMGNAGTITSFADEENRFGLRPQEESEIVSYDESDVQEEGSGLRSSSKRTLAAYSWSNYAGTYCYEQMSAAEQALYNQLKNNAEALLNGTFTTA